MNDAMSGSSRQVTPPRALVAIAVILVAAASMALTGCADSGNPAGSADEAGSAPESRPAAEDLYFYALSPEVHVFHLLRMEVDQAGTIEGTDTVVRLHENDGTEVREVGTEFVGTRSDDAFELERLHDGRIVTAVLEDGVLTFTDGSIGNHDQWTQIESTDPFEDMLDVHQEANEGCEDSGHDGCEYNNLVWPTELPTGD